METEFGLKILKISEIHASHPICRKNLNLANFKFSHRYKNFFFGNLKSKKTKKKSNDTSWEILAFKDKQ